MKWAFYNNKGHPAVSRQRLYVPQERLKIPDTATVCSGHQAGIHHIQTSTRLTPNRSFELSLEGESELTLWLQLLDDGQGAHHSHRCDGLHTLFCDLTHRLQVRILILCGDISRGDEVICGAYQGQVGDPSHHALQPRRKKLTSQNTRGGKGIKKQLFKIHTGCGSTAADTIFLRGERKLWKRNLFQNTSIRPPDSFPSLSKCSFQVDSNTR